MVQECQKAYTRDTFSDRNGNSNDNINSNKIIGNNNDDGDNVGESNVNDDSDYRSESDEDDVGVKIVITDRMICAASPTFDADACQGDSGGIS